MLLVCLKEEKVRKEGRVEGEEGEKISKRPKRRREKEVKNRGSVKAR